MTTVTIGRAYFDALLRRAQFHTAGREFELAPDLSNNVTISNEEHDHLQQCRRDYSLLRSALFRGGLTAETLRTLLAGESDVANDDPSMYEYSSEKTFTKPRSVSVTMRAPHEKHISPISDNTDAGSEQLDLPQPRPLQRDFRNCHPGLCVDDCSEEDQEHTHEQSYRKGIPVYDQRTVLITNLPERATHKDLVSVVRGGRLLDIFLRHDRSATVSFVEGAADFLAYAKRNDIYLHTKRLDFRWADRQFHVPPHISNKIAGGASRNLIVRGVASKVTEGQIRDHVDHIHNLVVVDLYFRNGDAYISTNSIHNALFARTCMMSRTVYKGTRIDWAPDECAAPLPQPSMRARAPAVHVPIKPVPITNMYALLDTGSSEDSDSQTESYMSNSIRLDCSNWAETAIA